MFDDETLFRKHIISAHKKHLFRCLEEGCNKTSREKAMFQLHNQKDHQYFGGQELLDDEQIEKLIAGKKKEPRPKQQEVPLPPLPNERECAYCGLKMAYGTKEDRKAFKAHMLVHLKCECGIGFQDEVSFQSHIEEHHGVMRNGEGPRISRSCSYCLRDFPFASLLDRHDYKEHVQDHMTCECNISFESETEFRSHLFQAHKKKFYRCSVEGCQFTTRYKEEFQLHNQKDHQYFSSQHLPVETCICPTCGKTYRDQHRLKEHIP